MGLDAPESTVTPKRTEQNIFIRTSKSEAGVTNGKREMRSMYFAAEANYR